MSPPLPHKDDLLALAHVTRSHGVHGELSAIPLTPPVLDAPALLTGRIYVRDAKGKVREATALGVRPHQDRLLITIEGVESIEDAEPWREVDLCLPRTELPPLPEGWYWEEDLIGCRVIDKTLGEIGHLKSINTHYVQPQLELERPSGQMASIPWVKALVTEVNLPQKEITTDLPAEYPGISD